MRKLVLSLGLGLGLFFTSCSVQPSLDGDSISPKAIKELKHNHVDTLLLVETGKSDYREYEYHFFKNDKEQTFVGSVEKYDANDTGFLLFFLFGLLVGLGITAIVFN